MTIRTGKVSKGCWISYIAKVLIQYLNIVMDDLKSFQFIASTIDAHAKIKSWIPALITGTGYAISNQCYLLLLTNNQNVRYEFHSDHSTGLLTSCIHNSVTLPGNKVRTAIYALYRHVYTIEDKGILLANEDSGMLLRKFLPRPQCSQACLGATVSFESSNRQLIETSGWSNFVQIIIGFCSSGQLWWHNKPSCLCHCGCEAQYL